MSVTNLAKRRGLPVYEFLDDLLGKVKKNQVGWCYLGVLGLLFVVFGGAGVGGPACQPLAFALSSCVRFF